MFITLAAFKFEYRWKSTWTTIYTKIITALSSIHSSSLTFVQKLPFCVKSFCQMKQMTPWMTEITSIKRTFSICVSLNIFVRFVWCIPQSHIYIYIYQLIERLLKNLFEAIQLPVFYNSRARRVSELFFCVCQWFLFFIKFKQKISRIKHKDCA